MSGLEFGKLMTYQTSQFKEMPINRDWPAYEVNIGISKPL